MTASTTDAPATHDPGLSRRTLGVPSITLMIIAASAPLTVVAGGVTTSFAVTGSLGVPLGFVVIAGTYLGLLDALWKPLIDKIL